MDDHLQLALIEIYYAMAEFRHDRASARQELDPTGARLIATMANLEELILIRQQEVGRQHAA